MHKFGKPLRGVAQLGLLPSLGGTAPVCGAERTETRFLNRPGSLTVNELKRNIAQVWGFAQFLPVSARAGRRRLSPQQQLGFLREINVLANPRFGVDRTIGSILERLRVLYGAQSCLLVTFDASDERHYWRRADGLDPESASHRRVLAEELASLFLAEASTHAMIRRSRGLFSPSPFCSIYDVQTNRKIASRAGRDEKLNGFLEDDAFISVPLPLYTHESGRIFLTSRSRGFDASDIDFLSQVMGHLVPLLKNIELVDRLACDAAEEERRRIARDIHDSIIQPYIGLQMGIEALRRKTAVGESDLMPDIERLNHLCRAGTLELRAYVRQLKDSREREGSLLPAVRRFVAKFTTATGIEVQVKANSDIRIHDRLAAEIFQMVAEGLSNIHRHTFSQQATIHLGMHDPCFVVRIENLAPAEAKSHGEAAQKSPTFLPVSLSERARALGGSVGVEAREDGSAVVTIQIPL